MASKKSKDYFGLSRIVSIILAVIPVTSYVCGIIVRIQEKHYLAAILRLLLGWNIIWILDIVFIVLKGKILRVL